MFLDIDWGTIHCACPHSELTMYIWIGCTITITIAYPHIEQHHWGEVSVSLSAHMAAELSSHIPIGRLKANVQIMWNNKSHEIERKNCSMHKWHHKTWLRKWLLKAKKKVLMGPTFYTVTETKNAKLTDCILVNGQHCSDSQISPITRLMPRASWNSQPKS